MILFLIFLSFSLHAEEPETYSAPNLSISNTENKEIIIHEDQWRPTLKIDERKSDERSIASENERNPSSWKFEPIEEEELIQKNPE